MYDATGTQGTNAQMLYTCPHCQGRFEFNTESLVRQIFCPLCGQGFDPVKIETMRYPEGGTPVAPSPGAAPETIQAANKDERLRVGTRLGQFRIDEFIGRGGMGAVYKATQTSLDRTVALKVLPRHMAEDPEFVQRFHREAKALAELNHPNIVSIYDKGNDEGQYFFAMEFVEGVSLRQLIKSKTVSPAQALALVPQLCEALEYAHSRGVIHRDIKPKNLLVDRSGRVKIADFGLARIIRGDNSTTFDGLTRSDVMMGTVNYMAPEQRENAKDVDHRADIYSLGVVIYELLTGDLPIGRFAAPSKKVQIDVRLDEVVLQLLERDREDRYQNVSDVKTGFARVMSDPPAPVDRGVRAAGPSSAAPPTPWWIRALPGGFLGVFGTGLAAAGIHLLSSSGSPAIGVLSLLGGLAGLVASFWIDHGRPAPGERVSTSETVGGFLMLALGLFAVGGFLVEATVANESFKAFWRVAGGSLFLVVSVVVFVGFEGLSSHLKTRSERGRWAGTVVNVMNLATALSGFVLVRNVPTNRDELAFQLMLGYPLAAAAVFGAGWWAAGPKMAAALPATRSEREIERPVDRWAMRVFQGGTFLWVVGAVSTALVGQGSDDFRGILLFGGLAAPVLLFGLTAVRRIGGAEDGRTGMRYALAGAAAAGVFPAMHLTGPFSLPRFMMTTFCSAWLFFVFAFFDAALRPSQRLGKYFGLGGALERRAWIAAIVGSGLIGGLAIAFDYSAVNAGRDLFVSFIPFVGTIAYVFLVAWGVPLATSGKECESECPILDKGVSIEANCPSGAGVSIHLGTSAPPVPSGPPASTPPPPPGMPIAEEIKAQVRAAIAEIPSAEEIKAQVRASLLASGIPVTEAAPAPSEKARRKGWNKTRSMWQEWLWHAGAFAIINAAFIGMGKWNSFSVWWGVVVAAHGLTVLFRTVVDPPHRPAATSHAQKRRKSVNGFLQHATWFAAIMTAMAYPDWVFPTLGWVWGIGLAFHLLSTVLESSFGKEAA